MCFLLEFSGYFKMTMKPLFSILMPIFLIIGLLICGVSFVGDDQASFFEEEVEGVLSEMMEEVSSLTDSDPDCPISLWFEMDHLANPHVFHASSVFSDGELAVRLSHWMIPLRI
jgi:hypothetical protein